MKRLHGLAASGGKHQVQAVAGLVLAVGYPIGTAVDPQKRNRRPLSPLTKKPLPERAMTSRPSSGMQLS